MCLFQKFRVIMFRLKLSLFLFLMPVCHYWASGQVYNSEEIVIEADRDTLSAETEYYAEKNRNHVDSLCVTIDSLRSALSMLDERYESVSDSLSRVIINQDKMICVLEANAAYVDSAMVRLANGVLYDKYDRSETARALKYLERIYTPSIKERYAFLPDILRDYEASNEEFLRILNDAQDDIDRDSPFAIKVYRERYLDRIRDMTYYIKYYKNKDKDWSIPYLDDRIAEAIGILESHSDSKIADFRVLISSL